MFHLTTDMTAALAGVGELDLLMRHAAAVITTPTVAARLTGHSREMIRAAVDAGTLPATGNIHRWITLTDLAEWHGRPFSPDDWHRTARSFKS